MIVVIIITIIIVVVTHPFLGCSKAVGSLTNPKGETTTEECRRTSNP
jgi:hypothetical protein